MPIKKKGAIPLYFWILLGLGFCAVLSFLVQRVKTGGLSGLFAKAVASVCFIAVAIAAVNRNPAKLGFGSFMIFGFVCGLLGDVWLDLKWVYEKDKDAFLFAGFLFFLLGHIAFISAEYTLHAPTLKTIVFSLLGALLIAVIALIIEKPANMVYGRFKTIVFCYTFVLSLTMTTAIAFLFASQFQPVWITMSAGSLLFLLSDLVLSGMYFSTGKNTSFNIILNHGLYYAAQFTLACAICFA